MTLLVLQGRDARKHGRSAVREEPGRTIVTEPGTFAVLESEVRLEFEWGYPSRATPRQRFGFVVVVAASRPHPQATHRTNRLRRRALDASSRPQYLEFTLR